MVYTGVTACIDTLFKFYKICKISATNIIIRNMNIIVGKVDLLYEGGNYYEMRSMIFLWITSGTMGESNRKQAKHICWIHLHF